MSENQANKPNTLLYWVIAILVLIIIGVGAVFLWQLLRNPISPPLDIIVPTNTTQPVQPAVPSATPIPAEPLSETCGRSDVMTILFQARDVSEGELPYGADVIRFVRVDFGAPGVRMIAVPRDLWVETPHLNMLNIQNSRLGPVFYYVEQNTIGTQPEKAVSATNAVAQAIYDNFAVTPDYYLFFEMKTFAEALDLLGGVDVNIPRDLDYGGYSFKAGPQHLDGQTALIYARLLPENEISDGWDRLERQNLILKAVWAKLLTPANIVLVPSLIETFNENIVTDLSPALIADLACMVDKVPQDQLILTQVDASMITGAGPDDSMLPDVDKVRQFLQGQLAP